MSDTTWIRAYNNKGVYTAGEMQAGTVRGNTYLCIGSDCRTSWPTGGGLPSGSSGQTLRHDGTNWVANSVIFNNGANVGIGTTTPSGKLTVVGSGGDARSVTIDNREIKFRGDGVAHFSIFGPDTGKSYLTIQNTGNNYLPGTAGTDLLTITSTGNVGIGTTGPGSKLDVRGITQITDDSASPDTSAYASFGVTRANVAQNNAYLGLTKQGVVPWGMGIDSGSSLIVGVSSTSPARTIPTPILTVTTGGNVGIGTTAPGYKLDVVGDIRAQNAWLRTTGNAGWYSDTYGGGWFMQDTTWIRAYNNKNIYTGGSAQFDGTLNVGGKTKSSSAYIPNGFSVSYSSSMGPGIGADNQWHIVTCPVGYAIYSVGVYATASFDGLLTTYCVNMADFLDTATVFWTTPTGDINNGMHNADCGAGYAATGIKAYATTYLDYGLSLQCTKLKTGLSSTAMPHAVHSNFDVWTGADNVFHHAECPTGTFIEVVAMYASTYLDAGLQLGCSYPTW